MTTRLNDRAVIAILGSEARDFLQGLITNDIHRVGPASPIYAALLTPQGKILFDFLISESDGTLLLDCPASERDSLARRLSLYRLRAKVEIAKRDDLAVVWSAENATGQPLIRDPRRPALGYRGIVSSGLAPMDTDSNAYTRLRLAHGVPEAADFGQDRMFALDADLDELGGVAFDKGCYVGQELTARMKHRGTARKRLLPVLAKAEMLLPAPPGAITAGDRELGSITSTYGSQGFALIRLDRLEEAVHPQANSVAVNVMKPDWLFT